MTVVAIIGLDLSLTSSGWSCGDTRKVLTSPLSGPERLHHLDTTIADLLDEIPEPRAVVLEGYAFATRHSRAHALGELGGVVRLRLWRQHIPFVEVPPKVRAKFATGNGNAGKDEVVSAVSARTGILFAGKGANDLCDAWVLEEAGRTVIGCPRYAWPKSHLAALEAVDWTPLHRYTEYSNPV